MRNQSGLNQLVLDRIEKAIEKGASTAQQSLNSLIEEGKYSNDYLTRIGIETMVNDTPLPDVVFRHTDENKIIMDIKEHEFTMHNNAIMQVSNKFNVPLKYMKDLISGKQWQRRLATDILNKTSENTQRQRVLIRTVADEARAVLSDHYKIMDSQKIVEQFLNAAIANGCYLYDGYYNGIKLWLDVLRVEPIVFDTAKNGEVALAFGARLSSSDFGAGSLELKTYMLQGVCLNGMVSNSLLRKVHLGSRLPENITFSRDTYMKDTLAQASAIKDLTNQLFDKEAINNRILSVKKASETEVDVQAMIKNLVSSQSISKAESEAIVKVMINSREVDCCAGENSLWKLTNAMTAHARNIGTIKPERKREIEELAGSFILN